LDSDFFEAEKERRESSPVCNIRIEVRDVQKRNPRGDVEYPDSQDLLE
jgi:hypothetical protein